MKALVTLANGFEEIESVCAIDILRRAGIQVTVASIAERDVSGAHGLIFKSDKLIADCLNDPFDVVVLPGGMPGATNLRDSEVLTEILKRQNSNGKLIAAICASPAVVLAHHGLLTGKKATCYAGFESMLSDATFVLSPVVVDGNLITSQGPGTAIEFSLALVKILVGDAKCDQLRSDLLIEKAGII